MAMGLFGIAMALAAQLPKVLNDAPAEASGQDDYVLKAPARAGTWERLEGKVATHRRKVTLKKLRNISPEARKVTDPVFAEYGRSLASRLQFMGFNTSGELRDDLRESTKGAVKDFMPGVKATDYQWVDAGPLGGSMACTGDSPRLETGVIMCAWADASTMSQVMISELNLSIDGAAALTREFREFVTQR
jgi:hypothetical protein